jgi:hypothetical protein
LEIILLAAEAAVTAAASTFDYFIDQELDDGRQNCVDHSAPVRDYLATVSSTTTGQLRGQGGRRPKLTPPQHLLNFVIFLKYSQYNLARSSVNDVSIFVASYIGVACQNEIKWPNPQELVELASRIPQLSLCIGFIDGTLCQVDDSSMTLCTVTGSTGARRCTT